MLSSSRTHRPTTKALRSRKKPASITSSITGDADCESYRSGVTRSTMRCASLSRLLHGTENSGIDKNDVISAASTRPLTARRRWTEAIEKARSLLGGGKEYATGRQTSWHMLRRNECA